ncbi:MAG TPA: fluoride efflux transporter CrcB [Gemmatimonadales bacterium]|jgi:CrcB protein|nr:fluoride efflux transporter CrcB [Gemmatimonadales bacterium]
MTVWYIALGGAVGSVARFMLGQLVQRGAGVTFPLGTLLINISGSFLLGFILRYSLATPAISPEVRALLTTGFCGGYTTFSTFSYETVALLEDGELGRAAIYIGLSVGVSLIATFMGFGLARELLDLRRGA